jgi:hypothetical protein
MTQPQQHPEELLAEFVEGTLGPEDRARVESHLSACASCREEVALAGPAREALSTLPELDAPAGTTWPVVQRARQRKRWLPPLSPRVAWATAGAAAVVIIVAFALIGGQIIPTSQEAAGPEAERELSARDEEAGDNAFSSADPETAQKGLAYPRFRRTAQDYDGAALASLAEDLAGQAKQALDRGFPEPPALYYTRTSALLALDARTKRALTCVGKAVSPDRSLAPFTVVAARFEGEPVYVGAFLQADGPDRPYAELVLYVVSREGCALRSFARQQL